MERVGDDKGVWPMDCRVLEKDWRSFKVGDTLDALDTEKKWYESRIVSVKISKEKIRVHYEGWSSKWDAWIGTNEICLCRRRCTCQGRLAALGSQSQYFQKNRRGSVRRVASQQGKPPHKGVTGLCNLGNTCFMGAPLQCLSNSPIFTSFFLSGRFESDINKKNPLGMGGNIALQYGQLMQKLWSGAYVSVVPRSFKRAIGRFAPRFLGYQQQDAHELLAFLLDGLHEDLNRVHDKPFTETVEGGDRPDPEVAVESWEVFRRRNRSVVVDLFMGQLKSTVTCPEDACTRKSVIFDPFRYLQVPVPPFLNRQILITVVPGDYSVPVTYGVVVDKHGHVKEVMEKLAAVCGRPWQTMTLCDVYKSRIHRVVTATRTTVSIRSQDVLVAFEEDPRVVVAEEALPENQQNTVVIEIVHKSTKTWPHENVLYGMPLLITVSPNLTNEQVHGMVLSLIYMWMKDLQYSRYQISECYSILYHNKNLNGCGLCRKSRCNGCVLPNDDKGCFLVDSDVLVVLWKDDDEEESDRGVLDAYMDASALSSVDMHSSANALRKCDIHAPSLYDCLSMYTQRERLGNMDAWYCNKCKEHRCAYKQLQLFSCPEILVVQLKRFVQINERRREKITTHIDYPIRGLDLMQFLAPSSPECGAAVLYDLYALVQHHGTSGGGHYTSLVKNRDNQQWYLFDDSRVSSISAQSIKTRDAYILFYRRRQ